MKSCVRKIMNFMYSYYIRKTKLKLYIYYIIAKIFLIKIKYNFFKTTVKYFYMKFSNSE